LWPQVGDVHLPLKTKLWLQSWRVIVVNMRHYVVVEGIIFAAGVSSLVLLREKP
jgi:hypothetical protein